MGGREGNGEEEAVEQGFQWSRLVGILGIALA
jgi:hypothetical protein